MHRNPELDVGPDRLAFWNGAARRRQSFRSLHHIHRRGLSFRAPAVLALRDDERPALAGMPALARLMREPGFCALVIAQADGIVLSRHARDFAANRLHSMQSITKTFVHLAIAPLVETGAIDLARPVGEHVPEAGTAFAGASVQQLLDMDIASNFGEDYAAPYAPCPPPGAPVGYARQEIAMGWRLPPEGEREFGVRAFAASLTAAPRGDDRTTRYASPNTDMLGWVIERASGRPLAAHVEDIVVAAGLESAFHVSADCEGVPVLSGGGVMTARDLARYGLLIARRGGPLLADALSGSGTHYGGSPVLRYRNHLMSGGTWVGHPGYAGQFLMVDPVTQSAAAFFSVLETRHGEREGYFAEIIAALGEALAQLR